MRLSKSVTALWLQRVFTLPRVLSPALGSLIADCTTNRMRWFDVPDQVLFKLTVTVHQCLNGRAPPYLSEHCIPVSSADTRRVPPTVIYLLTCYLLAVPGFWLNTYGRREFSVAGPTAWNSSGFYPGSSEQHRLFKASTQNVLVRAILVNPGVVNDNALYPSRTHSPTQSEIGN